MNPEIDQDDSLLNVFQVLSTARKGVMKTAPVTIPDTIAYQHGSLRWWYFYEQPRVEKNEDGVRVEKGGQVSRKDRRECSHDRIVSHFAKKAAPGTPVATFMHKRATPRFIEDAPAAAPTVVEFMDAQGLRNFLSNRDARPDGILQKFVCTQSLNAVVQVIWTPYFARATRYQNVHKISNTRIGLYERCVTHEGRSQYSHEVACSPHIVRELSDACKVFSEHYYAVEHKLVTRLVLYFKFDQLKLLFLYPGAVVTARFPVHNPPISNSGYQQPDGPPADAGGGHKSLKSVQDKRVLLNLNTVYTNATKDPQRATSRDSSQKETIHVTPHGDFLSPTTMLNDCPSYGEGGRDPLAPCVNDRPAPRGAAASDLQRSVRDKGTPEEQATRLKANKLHALFPLSRPASAGAPAADPSPRSRLVPLLTASDGKRPSGAKRSRVSDIRRSLAQTAPRRPMSPGSHRAAARLGDTQLVETRPWSAPTEANPNQTACDSEGEGPLVHREGTDGQSRWNTERPVSAATGELNGLKAGSDRTSTSPRDDLFTSPRGLREKVAAASGLPVSPLSPVRRAWSPANPRALPAKLGGAPAPLQRGTPASPGTTSGSRTPEGFLCLGSAPTSPCGHAPGPQGGTAAGVVIEYQQYPAVVAVRHGCFEQLGVVEDPSFCVSPESLEAAAEKRVEQNAAGPLLLETLRAGSEAGETEKGGAPSPASFPSPDSPFAAKPRDGGLGVESPELPASLQPGRHRRPQRGGSCETENNGAAERPASAVSPDSAFAVTPNPSDRVVGSALHPGRHRPQRGGADAPHDANLSLPLSLHVLRVSLDEETAPSDVKLNGSSSNVCTDPLVNRGDDGGAAALKAAEDAVYRLLGNGGYWSRCSDEVRAQASDVFSRHAAAVAAVDEAVYRCYCRARGERVLAHRGCRESAFDFVFRLPNETLATVPEAAVTGVLSTRLHFCLILESDPDFDELPFDESETPSTTTTWAHRRCPSSSAGKGFGMEPQVTTYSITTAVQHLKRLLHYSKVYHFALLLTRVSAALTASLADFDQAAPSGEGPPAVKLSPVLRGPFTQATASLLLSYTNALVDASASLLQTCAGGDATMPGELAVPPLVCMLAAAKKG
ncbi:hypothetical protein DIPPA_12889 [Diplonema papillatum]|nr:hypothetical protein DIPPA_12889 [Diplonema papillatum]